LVAVCLLTTQAFADWQYTKWGSTLEELRAIPNQTILTTSPKEQKGLAFSFGTPMAKTTYKAMETTFDVNFLFENNKLNGVVLYMKDIETAARIGTALGDQYGKPEKDTADYDKLSDCYTTYRLWRDEQAGNVVSFRSWACVGPDAPSSFHVMYRPIISKANSGL
jgi:hypothetical protein